MKRFAIAALPLLLANCAAITTGTSQTVSVSTDPAGAVCRLDRGGETVGIINPTPGSVNLSKSKDHVTVFCQKEGFEDNTGPLASSFQGMTFGNILFGGLVGLTIDAASGAMHEYPSSVTSC